MQEANAASYEVILRGSLAALDARVAALEAELADAKAARGATARLLRGYGDGALGNRSPVTVEELNRCASQREGLKMIGERSGGRIRLGEAVKLIHQSDLTSAKLPSLRATLHRYVKESPEWVEEGRGFYRLVGSSNSDTGVLEGTFRVNEGNGRYTRHRFRKEPGEAPVVYVLGDDQEQN